MRHERHNLCHISNALNIIIIRHNNNNDIQIDVREKYEPQSSLYFVHICTCTYE